MHGLWVLEESTPEMIPEISKNNLAEFCDIFCEDGYFNQDQTIRIAEKAKEYNLNIDSIE